MFGTAPLKIFGKLEAGGLPNTPLFQHVHSTYYISWINRSGDINKLAKNQRYATHSAQEDIILVTRR
jgi:hypothetical protein